MTLDVEQELGRLDAMTVAELRKEYARVWGHVTRSPSKPHLVKRIIWRLQATADGWGEWPPPELLKRAYELADLRFIGKGRGLSGSPTTLGRRVTTQLERPRDARLPKPGTTLIRPYKGRKLRVSVRVDGFEYEGRLYRTLSAVARHITQTHINGYRFFNLGAVRDS